MNRWQVGDVRITRIVEMEVVGGTRFILPQATPEAVSPMQWLVPHFATPEGKLIMSVHALVIETPNRLMLVDTCIGNDKVRSIPNWHQLSLPFLEDLAKAGYEPEQFDTIMCTHLHVDHVGVTRLNEAGITRGKGPQISFDAGYGVENFDPSLVDLFVPTDRQMALRYPGVALSVALENDSLPISLSSNCNLDRMQFKRMQDLGAAEVTSMRQIILEELPAEE